MALSVDFRKIMAFTWSHTYSPSLNISKVEVSLQRSGHNLRELVLQKALAPIGITTHAACKEILY
jgi:hypothetical protein